MGLPAFREARVFYQAAKQRFEDARFLLDAQRTTAAVYLAGYGVECILKALVLSGIASQKKRTEMLASFRGRRGHELVWLRTQYLERGGASLPANIARNFTQINTWTTDMRYWPGTIKPKEAERFLKAAEAVIVWADGRM